MTSMRLDQSVLSLGLAKDISHAHGLILAGEILVNNQIQDKVGVSVSIDAEIRLKQEKIPFVSRGGFKLDSALRHWNLSVPKQICVDYGSSTGGFTDCLIQRGARKVYAVDVGTNQLDWKLRSHPKVVSMENTNARSWDPTCIPDRIDFLCADLSFISLKKVIPSVQGSLKEKSKAVLLIKPQFEAKREEVGSGGIVTDALTHQRICDDLFLFFSTTDLKPREVISSPILGQKGNQEFLMLLQYD